MKKMIKTYILFCLLILISGCSLALTKPDDNENENNNFDNEENLVVCKINGMIKVHLSPPQP